MQSAYPELQSLDDARLRALRICRPTCFGNNRHCRMCGGHGYVCPTCRGAKWLVERPLLDPDDVAVFTAPKLVRCNDCGLPMTDGWVYDAEQELRTVEAWLFRWLRGEVPDERAAEEARITAERLVPQARRQASRVAQSVAWNQLYAPAPAAVDVGPEEATTDGDGDDDLDEPF